MSTTEELKAQKTVVALFRCGCKHCDVAEEELKQLTGRYGVEFKVNYVEKMMGLEKLAGWSTPIVTVNGKKLTHFRLDVKRWDEAIGMAVNKTKGVEYVDNNGKR